MEKKVKIKNEIVKSKISRMQKNKKKNQVNLLGETVNQQNKTNFAQYR